MKQSTKDNHPNLRDNIRFLLGILMMLCYVLPVVPGGGSYSWYDEATGESGFDVVHTWRTMYDVAGSVSRPMLFAAGAGMLLAAFATYTNIFHRWSERTRNILTFGAALYLAVIYVGILLFFGWSA